MPFASGARQAIVSATIGVVAMLLAGCANQPPAPCAEVSNYPVPAMLCLSSSEPRVTGSLQGAPEQPATTGGAAKMSTAERPGSREGKLGLGEVLRRLIRTNPDVGIAAAREKEQYAAVAGANAGFLPTVDAVGGIGPQRQYETSPAGNAIRREAGLSVRQTIYDFGIAQSNFDRTALAYQSATSARVAKTEQTAYDMLEALMKVQQIDETIVLTRRNIATHERILKLVQSSEANGNSTLADSKRVTTRLESAKTSLIDLVTDRTNAADAFRRLTELEVDRVADTTTRRLVGRPDDLDQERLDLNPEVQSILSEIASLREQLKGVEAGVLPNLGVEGNWKYGRQVSEPDVTSDKRMYGNVLLSLRVPLYDGGLNDSARQQVRARIEGAQLRLEKRRRELREEAQGAVRITSSDRDKTGTLAARVASARQVQDLYLMQFRDGTRTIFEVLDAQVDLVKAEGDLILQTYTRRRSQIRALLLRGTLVQSILSADPV